MNVANPLDGVEAQFKINSKSLFALSDIFLSWIVINTMSEHRDACVDCGQWRWCDVVLPGLVRPIR